MDITKIVELALTATDGHTGPSMRVQARADLDVALRGLDSNSAKRVASAVVLLAGHPVVSCTVPTLRDSHGRLM